MSRRPSRTGTMTSTSSTWWPASKEGMKETLLHERAGESFFTDPDLAAVDPAFGDRSRPTRKTEEPPRRTAGEEVAVEELRALVEDHLRPRGDRDLDR